MNKTMWGEAVYTAAYLLNRTPSKSIETTPTEMWTKKKLNLNQIKLFRCDVFAKTLGPLRKLDERSKKYKMIGYTTNGYRP